MCYGSFFLDSLIACQLQAARLRARVVVALKGDGTRQRLVWLVDASRRRGVQLFPGGSRLEWPHPEDEEVGVIRLR